ncbi:hypothetical protein EBR78_06485 [bacterium]|nr:hypothetical protein [bacterium]NBX83547.1 hypothetical protein [bacterium]
MKRPLIVLGLVASLSCVANEPSFESHKSEMLQHIEEKITKMNEHKTCVSNATSPEALKQCRESMKAWHRDEKMERMEKRKERMEKRMEKMKEKQS